MAAEAPLFQLVETTVPQQRAVDNILFPLVLTPSQTNSSSTTATTINHSVATTKDIPATSCHSHLTSPSAVPITSDNSDPPSADVSHVVSWILTNREWLLREWQRHGAVLLRGLPLSSPSHFDALVDALGLPELPYVGGAAPRTKVVGRVFTANESPPDQLIPFHHEMAQVPEYPHHVFFFCEVPPAFGGETPLLPSWELTRQLAHKHPSFVSQLREKGLRYVRVLPEEDDSSSAIGRGWKSTFLTTNKQEAERKAANLNVTLEWLPDGSVRSVSGALSALRMDTRSLPGREANAKKQYGGGAAAAAAAAACPPVDSASSVREAWFNSMVAAYTGWSDVRNDPTKAVTFGDGEPLPGDVVLDVAKEMEALAVAIPWRAGDVLLVDNLTVQHARRAFKPPRRIMASLAK